MGIVWFILKAHRKWALGFGRENGITAAKFDQEKYVATQKNGLSTVRHHLSPPDLRSGDGQIHSKSTVSPLVTTFLLLHA